MNRYTHVIEEQIGVFNYTILSNRSQSIMVDGCRSTLVNVCRECRIAVFLLYTSELFSILENKLIGYADDSTLMTVVPSPGVRGTEAEFPKLDLGLVSVVCPLQKFPGNLQIRTCYEQIIEILLGIDILI